MTRTVILITLMELLILSCSNSKEPKMNNPSIEAKEMKQDSISGYAPVNGLNMYYEIHGSGEPLVLIHGGGSTIETTFGRVLHSFAKNRKIIAVELQGHGHTKDIDRPETFENDADDVAALLKYLKIDNADILGFSNGGSTTMQIAIRHPELVRKIVVASAFYKREGMFPGFFGMMEKATLKDMPQQLQEYYLKVAPDSTGLIKMFEKDRVRMVGFKDWDDSVIQSIQAPAFVISSDQDVASVEHITKMFRLFKHAKLSILPGAHGGYIGEITTGMEHSKLPELTVTMINEFLDEPMPEKK